MKTKAWVLTTLVFLIAAIGNASDLPKMSVTLTEAGKTLITYNAPEATPLEITLSNSKGDIVYFNRTTDRYKNYSEEFDFSSLGNGNYLLCFNYGNRSVNRLLSVSGEKITVGPEHYCYEPCFRLENKMLNISFLNLSKKQVYVNVYQDGKQIDGLKMGKNFALQKCLDLTNLKTGQYEIVVTDCFKDHKYIAKL